MSYMLMKEVGAKDRVPWPTYKPVIGVVQGRRVLEGHRTQRLPEQYDGKEMTLVVEELKLPKMLERQLRYPEVMEASGG